MEWGGAAPGTGAPLCNCCSCHPPTFHLEKLDYRNRYVSDLFVLRFPFLIVIKTELGEIQCFLQALTHFEAFGSNRSQKRRGNEAYNL